MNAVKLTAELVESFAGIFLSPMYDEAKPTPPFHREGWELYCSTAIQAAIAAPRGHAKSTAFTHDFILACVLFREESYVVIISSNEEMAIEHLGDITQELRNNDELRREFQISRFVIEAKTDIIVECADGHQFRIIARGSGQKMRGRKWQGMRPGLIVCDDLEDDEQVESLERRKKFRQWFLRALKPALRDGGRLRIHGTILHEDSLLSRLMRDPTWASLFYKAHASFDDFTEILWPEQFPVLKLLGIRKSLIEQGDAAGYAQEYLNDPIDSSEAYLRRDDFQEMQPQDYDSPKLYFVGVDLAATKADQGNRTSFTIGGKDVNNLLHIVDQRAERWSPAEWVEVIFEIESRWHPKAFFIEGGAIWISVWPFLQKECIYRETYPHFEVMTSMKDKATRGRSLQKRMRAGAVRFNKQASWYPGYEMELLRFTGVTQATLDDQFDSTVQLSRGLDLHPELQEDDFYTEEEIDFLAQRRSLRQDLGRSRVTGY